MKKLLIPLLISVSAALSSATDERPNIIVIMCDDLGYSDVGFNGAKDIQTPELDRLAENGTICSAGYVTHPFCGPSRMGFMAGRYPHEFGAPYNLPNWGQGIEEYNEKGIDVEETLFSKVLQDAGYHTGIIGKWHLGMTTAYHPNNRGFDDFYGFLGGGHYYFHEKFAPIYERQSKAGRAYIHEYLHPLERNGVQEDEKEYITDALSREAAQFVSDRSGGDEPFFLFLSYNAPHTPLEAKEEDIALYSKIENKDRRIYAAMVHAVDRGVGELVEALKEANSFEDTLIVFLSDNGGKTSAGATNRPLAKGKGSVTEGGYRVPMFFHWPKGVPSGRVYDHPISALDFYPTFAGLGGAAIPEGKHLDGKDIWEDFIANESARKGEMIYAMRHRGGASDVGARRDQWKILKEGHGPWRLYDVALDKGEKRDLAAQHPERLREMVSEVERWSRTHTEPLWFDGTKARDIWIDTEMPQFEKTFSIGK